MAKYRVLSMCMSIAASVTLSMAQGTQVRSSSAKAGADPQNITKPLTPKSAMPPQRKSAPVAPKVTGVGSTNAELIRLERQPIKAETPKSGVAKSAKGAPLVKSADASAGTGPGINFKYQKPVGGMQATVPNAQSPNSSTPRVKKN